MTHVQHLAQLADHQRGRMRGGQLGCFRCGSTKHDFRSSRCTARPSQDELDRLPASTWRGEWVCPPVHPIMCLLNPPQLPYGPPAAMGPLRAGYATMGPPPYGHPAGMGPPAAMGPPRTLPGVGVASNTTHPQYHGPGGGAAQYAYGCSAPPGPLSPPIHTLASLYARDTDPAGLLAVQQQMYQENQVAHDLCEARSRVAELWQQQASMLEARWRRVNVGRFCRADQQHLIWRQLR